MALPLIEKHMECLALSTIHSFWLQLTN